MKRIVLVLSALILTMGVSYSKNSNEDRYVLYPTQNMWTFLKLDTSNGKIWQVQYSLNGPDYRFETSLNQTSFVLDADRPAGRFKLYPTANTYNFVLIDTKIGTTYQVQWSQDYDQRMVIPISLDAPLVWSCGYAKVKSEYLNSWNYYDENKNYLSSDFFDSCEDFVQGYAKVQKDGKINYIDTTGCYLFNKWYDNCRRYNMKNIVWVRDNGKENYLDVNQNPILEQWYDECSYKQDGYYEVGNAGKYNIVDSTGKSLFAEWFDYIGYIGSDGFIKVEKDGKYNYVALDGTTLLKEWYSYCGDIIDGVVVISKDDKWNYVDVETGVLISRVWFDDCKSFNEQGTAEVKIGDKWYSIVKSGTLEDL